MLFSVLGRIIAEGCAVLMVTHDVSDLDWINASRIITLSEGRIKIS